MKTLQEITTTLNGALGSPALFQLVSTRVALSTGVNLGDFSPSQDTHAESVTKVLRALASMGYTEESLILVARRKNS